MWHWTGLTRLATLLWSIFDPSGWERLRDLGHLRFSTYFVDPDEESDGTGMAKLYWSNGRLTSRSGRTKKTEEDKRRIIGCTVLGQTWKTYLQNISRRFYWNRILWRHLLLERKRRKSEDSGLWKEINKSIAGLKKFPVIYWVQTIVYIIYIVCIVWDQRGSKCNINNDSVSKELQPETPGNVNGHDETLVSYPANRVVECCGCRQKSMLSYWNK